MSPDTKNPSPGYLSLKALARELSVSDRTVHALIHDKVDPIPCHRIGRKIIRVHRADLKAWMDRRRSIIPDDQLSAQAEAIVGRMLRGEQGYHGKDTDSRSLPETGDTLKALHQKRRWEPS